MAEYMDAVKLWQSYPVNSSADLDKYLDNFRILFAYHSGKIENAEITYHDTREIFENGKVLNFSGSPRTLFEQQNQKLCYEALKERIVQKEPLSISLVQEIHRILTAGTYDERRYVENEERPGEFKKHDYVTGVHEVGSAAEDVEQELCELFDEINAQGKSSPLKAGAYLHARFEYIHPFADGNGRVGRTLLNYWLMINDYPPLIVYDDDKKEYYDALQRYDESEDLSALYAFLQREALQTWAKALKLEQGEQEQRKGISDFLQGM